jgi:methylmalonyl-CoA mutase
MQHSLFDSFDSISAKEWKDQVIKDLKGKDFDETLKINDQIEGISYTPLFHKDDQIEVNSLDVNLENDSNSFQNIVQIDCSSQKANELIISSLMNGADGIWFKNLDFSQFNSVCKDILFDCIVATFEINSKEDADLLAKELQAFNKTATLRILCDVNADIIKTFEGFSNCKIVVNGLHFHNEGANISQEIAFTLNKAIDFTTLLKNQNISMNLSILLGAGSNYFYEIAKYRAFRCLWKNIMNHAGFQQENLEIHGCTGRVNMTMADHHNNLLRQTTQCMSACLGGADFVSVEPYDTVTNDPDERILRMAKNIPLILKEEGYLDKVIDPANGSYYIEWLTNQWIDRSFELFKQIQHDTTLITSEIEKTVTIRKALFSSNDVELIGVNVFENKNLEPLNRTIKEGFTYESNEN